MKHSQNSNEKMVKLLESESVTLEYKRKFDSDTIRKTVVAFANTKGGVLKIGVDDDRTVVGVDQKIIDRVTQTVRDGSVPPLAPQVDIESHGSKDIITVAVRDHHNIPYSAINGVYYIRVGAITRQASLLELIDLIVKGPHKGTILMKTRLPELNAKINAGIQHDEKQALVGLSELEQLLMQLMDEDTKSTIITMVHDLIDEADQKQCVFRNILNILVSPLPFNIQETSEKFTAQDSPIQIQDVLNGNSPFASQDIFDQIITVMRKTLFKFTINPKVTIFTRILINRIYQFGLVCIYANYANQLNQILEILAEYQEKDQQLTKICKKATQQLIECIKDRHEPKRLAWFVQLPAGGY